LDKQEALSILEEIEDNVGICCAITMEPDEVLVLIDKLKSYIENE
jgi:hypothetical protein|tara:strand:+ start:23 stop:157 length:135 start_codon:yes stop_codon:yes gene_type:complete